MTTFLGTADLNRMRAEFERTLPETVVISRPAGSADGMGGSIQTFSAVGTVNARVDPSWRKGEEREFGGRTVGEASWVVVMAFDEDVRRSDRITHQGRSLEVVEVRTPQSWEILTRCECVELS